MEGPVFQFQAMLQVHPTVISDSFAAAAGKAAEILAGIAIPVDLADREALIRAANTCAPLKQSSHEQICFGSTLSVQKGRRPPKCAY